MTVDEKWAMCCLPNIQVTGGLQHIPQKAVLRCRWLEELVQKRDEMKSCVQLDRPKA